MYIEEFVWGTSLFLMHALLSMSFFVAFFVYSSTASPSQVTNLVNGPVKIDNIAMGSTLCDDIVSEWSKYENLLQFNTSWLISF